MQEPASTIFSALNGLSHVAMLRYFRARISHDAPLYYLWHFYAVVCIFRVSLLDIVFLSPVYYIRPPSISREGLTFYL